MPGNNNQGIVHIAWTAGGKPLCGNRRAYMSTTPERIGDWPRVCARCTACLNRIRSKRPPAEPQHNGEAA